MEQVDIAVRPHLPACVEKTRQRLAVAVKLALQRGKGRRHSVAAGGGAADEGVGEGGRDDGIIAVVVDNGADRGGGGHRGVDEVGVPASQGRSVSASSSPTVSSAAFQLPVART